ncbi:MAG: hypothetical protein EGR51_00830, partial [Oscillibacter sp.]|nr:hypothetical protein [Oscillibacter sp.]
MSGIKIRGTGRFAPAKIVTNDDLAKIVDTSDEWITTRTGIQTRHHCTTETHTDMCVGAARQALENAGISPEDIGACVVATFSSDYLSPSAACMVQRGLGLPHDAVCFDLNAACSGFLFAIHTMECLLAQAPRKYGLVIGAEMLSRFINWEDRGTCVLFGDGAGAVVVLLFLAYLKSVCGPGSPSSPVTRIGVDHAPGFPVDASIVALDIHHIPTPVGASLHP